MLCYTNASACLPQVFGTPDWDFLAVTIGFVVGLCALTFVAGHLLGRLLGADRDAQAALMFGMGMNNNGTGLVLASAALASQPLVLLPIIAYNLAQHLAASCACAALRRATVSTSRARDMYDFRVQGQECRQGSWLPWASSRN